ncbi:hypothetical protein OG21DRAFT_375039 [Imleria badia]|nr:hypothetical protein OG21DRAFT_375039 [Imleria badia]
MKRAESAVSLDNRKRVELKALRFAKQTEMEKSRQGKAGWWMKQSEKKELLVKARLDAFASVGGKKAAKKAKNRTVRWKEKTPNRVSRLSDGNGAA